MLVPHVVAQAHDVLDSTLVRFLLQQSLVHDMLMDSVPQFAVWSCSCALVECGRFWSCPKEFLCTAPRTWVCIVYCLEPLRLDVFWVRRC